MTQKEKDLLLRDLCARLPYKPIVQIGNYGACNLRGIDHDNSTELRDRAIVWNGEKYPSSTISFPIILPIIDCKPYLFPLSSMTEEQLFEVQEILGKNEIEIGDGFFHIIDSCRNTITYLEILAVLEWFYKNHFDINNLIPMGLAIDATGLNIY